jgi:hypothetical protein
MIVVTIKGACQGELSVVGRALRCPGGGFGPGQNGKKEGGEKADDGNYYEELEQSKPGGEAPVFVGMPSSIIHGMDWAD